MSYTWMVAFGCQSSALQPITTEDYVDLERFMGDWYVIAHIPTFIERRAHNAVESYSLSDSGRVNTRFAFNQGGLDGERKVYNPTGFVLDQASNAVWKMQFIWPIKADYRIVHVDEEYQETIVGREARDFVWIMARTPTISDDRYARLLSKVAAEGYDLADVRRVPHGQVPQGSEP
jgi:apolipoprotein D and lipocalin family protein